LYLSAFATRFDVSPDEKWLAWQEKFNVYVTPFVRTGKSVDIGPDTKSLPVAKATKEGGSYLHWSGDSSRLYWSLGPELFDRDLKDAFAFLAGDDVSSRASARDPQPQGIPRSARNDTPPEHGINIGFNE